MLPLTTREGLAQLIDHPLVKPELTDEQVIEGLELAKRYHIASASVRPCDIDLAVRTLQGSGVKPGAVCGFPHGSQNTATKLYEARDLLRRGAREIDMVVAISKLLSREFQHVQMELLQMSELCHKEGALLKVILENAYLTDELKIIACRCCERAEVGAAGENHAGHSGVAAVVHGGIQTAFVNQPLFVAVLPNLVGFDTLRGGYFGGRSRRSRGECSPVGRGGANSRMAAPVHPGTHAPFRGLLQ